jgi:hypothetical protein
MMDTSVPPARIKPADLSLPETVKVRDLLRFVSKLHSFDR